MRGACAAAGAAERRARRRCVRVFLARGTRRQFIEFSGDPAGVFGPGGCLCVKIYTHVHVCRCAQASTCARAHARAYARTDEPVVYWIGGARLCSLAVGALLPAHRNKARDAPVHAQ